MADWSLPREDLGLRARAGGVRQAAARGAAGAGRVSAAAARARARVRRRDSECACAALADLQFGSIWRTSPRLLAAGARDARRRGRGRAAVPRPAAAARCATSPWTSRRRSSSSATAAPDTRYFRGARAAARGRRGGDGAVHGDAGACRGAGGLPARIEARAVAGRDASS